MSWCNVLINFGRISLSCIYFLICACNILINYIFLPYISVDVINLNSGKILCSMTNRETNGISYQILHVIPRGSNFEAESVKKLYLKKLLLFLLLQCIYCGFIFSAGDNVRGLSKYCRLIGTWFCGSLVCCVIFNV